MKALTSVCCQQLNHKHVQSWTDRQKERKTEIAKQSAALVGHILWLDCVVSLGAHQGQRQLRSDVREAWQHLNSVALLHVSWEMRGCRAWPGVKGQNCALSELRSNYRRLNPLTHRRVMKGFADSFETPRRGYLFVSVRILKLERREEEGRRGRQWGSYLLVSHARSCRNSRFFPLCFLVNSRSIVRETFPWSTTQ